MESANTLCLWKSEILTAMDQELGSGPLVDEVGGAVSVHN